MSKKIPSTDTSMTICYEHHDYSCCTISLLQSSKCINVEQFEEKKFFKNSAPPDPIPVEARLWHTPILGFYRAMHFSAKRGIAIACRLSVRL